MHIQPVAAELPKYVDTHCHIDLYPNPEHMCATVDASQVFTVAVTLLPSHFRAGFPHIQRFKYVRLALGLHPLRALEHQRELEEFRRLLPKTKFIGEIGLDFSKQGQPTRKLQEQSFKAVLRELAGKSIFTTLHSRGAESAVLEQLLEHGIRHAVFHWFTGPPVLVDDLVAGGYYLSVNSAMIKSASGRRIVDSIPPDRVLTETDGPYVQVAGRRAVPGDVIQVVQYLAAQWAVQEEHARALVVANWLNATAHIR